jgi:hypothetical protein
MKYRKLRIAWSVAWGVAAVLLCLLWVRSYWRLDRMDTFLTMFNPHRSLSAISAHGFLMIGVEPDQYGSQDVRPAFFSTGSVDQIHAGTIDRSWLGFKLVTGNMTFGVQFSLWFAVLTASICALAPWLRCRFSLRTLLIAITLVAVALGAIIWAAK